MTTEQLKKATKINHEIEELEEFQKVFQKTGLKCISAESTEGCIQHNKSIIISSRKDICMVISDYVSGRIEELKKEFDAL